MSIPLSYRISTWQPPFTWRTGPKDLNPPNKQVHNTKNGILQSRELAVISHSIPLKTQNKWIAAWDTKLILPTTLHPVNKTWCLEKLSCNLYDQIKRLSHFWRGRIWFAGSTAIAVTCKDAILNSSLVQLLVRVLLSEEFLPMFLHGKKNKEIRTSNEREKV